MFQLLEEGRLEKVAGWIPAQAPFLGSPVADRIDIDTLALDAALQRLEELDPTQSKIVELRFFGGLTIEETAEAIGSSPATVKREWAIAKSWLHRELTTGRRGPDV